MTAGVLVVVVPVVVALITTGGYVAVALIQKVNVIHALVNSQFTEAKEGELYATLRDIASLGELAALKKAASVPANGNEAMRELEAAHARAAELRTVIAARKAAAA